MKKYLVLTLIFSLCLTTTKVFSQASLETFGHNRVQHETFDWRYYKVKHFKIYFSGRRGRQLARFVAEQAERDVEAIEHNAGGLFPNQISIILYNSYDAFKQSNIGLNSALQMQNNNPAGTVHLLGDKLVIFFNGSHANLKKQIRQGMAQVIMEHLIFGANFREMARNAVLLDMPHWVTDGYADYLVDGWTSKDDNEWKNIITQNKKLYFKDLAIENPRLAGKAFWQYIVYKHGANSLKNLLYLLQLKGSINKASKLAFHQKLYQTFDSVITFYQNRYQQEKHLFEPFDTANALIKIPIPDNQTRISNIKVSPRGSDVAYVSWKNGEYKVILEKTHKINGKINRERSTILYGGVKDFSALNDPNYPLLAWDNTGYRLGIIYKKGNNIFVKVYNSLKATLWNYKIPNRRIDRITGFSFLEDYRNIVLTGIKDGQSDLFTLNFRGYRLHQITDDTWDDANPIYVAGGSRKGIVFLSNRPEPYINIQPLPNELPTGKMNAFFYNLTTKSYTLLQLTHDSTGQVNNVIPYGPDNFAYLSNKNGINNRYLVLFARNKHNMDSAFSIPVTNYGRSIQYQNYNPASQKVADAVQYKNAFYVYFKPISIPRVKSAEEVPPLPTISFLNKKEISNKADTQHNEEEILPKKIFHLQTEHAARHNVSANGIKINSGGDAFQSAFSDNNTSQNIIKDSTTAIAQTPANTVQNQIPVTKNSNPEEPAVKQTPNGKTARTKDGKQIRYVDSSFLRMRSHRYYLSFRPDFLSLRLDNNLIFNRYQSYGQNAGQYRNPSLAGMIMARLFDKMEDYRFTGGLRIPANFSGLAYFLQFENFKKHIDWGMTLYREADKQSYNFAIGNSAGQPIIQLPGKTITNILQAKAIYPMDEVKGIHLFLGARQDKMILKAQDNYGLALPNVQDVWGMARLAFVSDNTANPAMNIWNGLRYKVYAETMYKVYSNNDAYQLNTDTTSFKKHSWIYDFGFDARYYHKIYKNFIFAMRLAGAHSGGTQQIIYFLGGEANSLNAKFENGFPPSQKMDYAFQSLATELRGYNQNARNGNTYVLANFELRLPIFSTFFHRPIESTILKNLQAVAFLDLGNAWEGLSPINSRKNRPYQFSWPPNTGAPVVSVQIPNTKDHGLAIGYGLGLRTMIWGYFIRADAAMNKDREFHWYLSFGTDF